MSLHKALNILEFVGLAVIRLTNLQLHQEQVLISLEG